jgi:hypothetical protein
MKKIIPFVAASVLALAYAPPAQARMVEYLSQHPVPHKFGDGFCYIDVPHIHNYPPAEPRLYRQVDNRFYFVGDPTPFGYDGPRFTYYGAHPVLEAEVRIGHPVYCYMKGPHVHWYAPPPHAHFQLSGGAYWYVGTFPPAYYDNRPRYAEINDAYAPVVYTRPVVDVQMAPPMFRADIAIGGPGFGARATIGVPPTPGPVYVAPAPVVVAPVPGPTPVQVGVDIHLGGPAPAPVFIDRGPVVEGRFRHDRGRHEGWWKDHRFDKHPPHGPPARYTPAPAPVRQPVWGRARPQGPTPNFVAAPRTNPRAPGFVAAPTRGPAPSPPGRAGPTRGPAAPVARSDRRPH